MPDVLDYKTKETPRALTAWQVVSFVLCALWASFWLFMAVVMFFLRALADEPGHPASIGFILSICTVFAAIGAPGIIVCWKIGRRRAADRG